MNQTDPTEPAPARIPPEWEEDDGPDLREYLRVVLDYKWAILGFAGVVTLLTALFVSGLPPIYQATATVLIESQEENVVSIEEVYGIPGANDQYFETQNRILQSRYLAEKVIDRLRIAAHPEYDPALREPGLLQSLLASLPFRSPPPAEPPPANPQDLRNGLVGQFRANLAVTPIRGSQLIDIRFESTDPALTAAVSNTLAEVYIDSNLEGRLAMTDRATGSLTRQLTELKQNLEQSEQALQAFRDQEKLIDVQGVGSLTAQELNKLTGQLVDMRRDRTTAETAYRQIMALQGRPAAAYETIPAVLRDPGLQGVKGARSAAERKVAELKKRYGPKHPKMIAAIAELGAAEENVAKQTLNVVEALKKDYEVLLAKEAHLNRAMSQTRRDMNEINRRAGQLIALERDVEANRGIYETFLSRYKETSAVSDIQPAHARVVDPAVVPSGPAKPNKRRMIQIAFILSLLLAMLCAILIEALDNTLENARAVEDKLRLPALGILPRLKIKARDPGALRYYSDHGQTPFAENIRTLRSGLLLSDIDQKQKVVLVTSAIAGEGKSMTAVSLALSLGQTGQAVLLVDCDLRRPDIGRGFGLPGKAAGLTHFMLGTHGLSQVIHKLPAEGISIIPAGAAPPNPLELLGSARLTKSLDALRQKFDHIVIDSAPCVQVSDAVVLSQRVNQVIYVVKADATTAELAEDGIKRLQKAGAPLLGVVLNQVAPPKKSDRYSYYSYYGYGQS